LVIRSAGLHSNRIGVLFYAPFLFKPIPNWPYILHVKMGVLKVEASQMRP